MKRLFISFLALSSLMLLVLSSCKKDETKTTSGIVAPGTVTASTTSPALSLLTSENTALTFNVAATAVSGYSAPITYTLQFDKKGNNFAAAREVSAVSGANGMTVSALNTILHNLSLADGVSSQVDVRAKSLIAANVDVVYSNVVTLTVTPYSSSSYVYVPGGYQAQAWTPSTAPSLVSATSNGIYEGTVEVPAATTDFGFKITTNQDWNGTNYGSGGDGKLSNAGTAGNLNFPAAGIYKIVANINAMTYTITKQ